MNQRKRNEKESIYAQRKLQWALNEWECRPLIDAMELAHTEGE